MLICSYSAESAALRCRQNSISASGPLPFGRFAFSCSTTVATSFDQSSIAASSCATTS